MSSIRTVLRDALHTSTQMRDRDATSVLRSTLAAIDNAEAVPIEDAERPAMKSLAGSTERARRELSDAERVAIVKAEIGELSRAASLLSGSAPDQAGQMRTQAEVLTVVLARAGH